MNKTIKTKYGNATIMNEYYVISSRKSKYFGKRLHRVIWEEHNGKIPEGCVIHHKDGNKTNNELSNLELMDWRDHSILHNVGRKFTEAHKKKLSDAHKGMIFTKEHKENIRNAMLGEKHMYYGKQFSDEHKHKLSKSHTSSGFYKVSKNKDKKSKTGFYWIYKYNKDNKRKGIQRNCLIALKEKINELGLLWEVVDEEKARKTCIDYGYNYSELC